MRVLVDAHRGASATCPENTLVAFRAALAAGADSVELDLHLSSDGVPVVIHDETVDRTTDGHGAVADMALATLRALDAGSWKGPGFAAERVPTLDEVLSVLGPAARFNLELKDADPRLVGRVAETVISRGARHRVMLSSFHLGHLQAAKALLPDVATHLFLDGPLPGGFFAGEGRVVDSLGVPWERVSRSLVTEAGRHGRPVWAWTIDNPEQALHLAGLGVRAITTNDPATIRSALECAGMR